MARESKTAKFLAERGKQEHADSLDVLQKRLRRGGKMRVSELAGLLGVTRGGVIDLCDELIEKSLNVVVHGDVVQLVRNAVPRTLENLSFTSDADGWHRFGVISDTHYGSKHAREDVCHDLYDWFEAEGIRNVLHAGNYIEGEGHQNDGELLPDCHGMQQQFDYFVQNYPEKKGITTWIVSGDDHEGWYAQREGIDVGRLLVSSAETYGRKDLRDCGYMECFFSLLHAKTGRSSKLWLVHPGGGSAYATSYAPQKMMESLQPGEKPAVALIGHFHKLEAVNIRGVWCIQTGCTKDQDGWGRKKRLQYHVGGLILSLKQDARGAIVDCIPHIRQYFDRGYYSGQFNLAGPIKKVRAPSSRRRVGT